MSTINDVIRTTDDSGDGKLSFKEWALVNIEGLDTASSPGTKIKAANEEEEGANPFFKLGYLSVFKMNELRNIFTSHLNSEYSTTVINNMAEVIVGMGHTP